MVLVVERVWESRYDDRLVNLTSEAWASASDRALTVWRGGQPQPPVLADEALPGPLEWLGGAKLIGWGPSTVGPEGVAPARVAHLVDVALAEVGEEDRRHFTLEVGAAGSEGRRVVAMVRRRPPPVREGRARPLSGPVSRLAVFDIGGGEPKAMLGDDLPQITAISWGDRPLLMASAGELMVVDERTWDVERRKLPTAYAPRALAVDGEGQVAAAMADGTVTTWTGADPPRQPWQAHSGPVRSLAWSPSGLLTSGGEDGVLRVWSSAATVADELVLGARGALDVVEAIVWLDEQHLVAKVGGQGGRLVKVERRK